MSGDTIFALSSGSPPAAIAVVRISGPRAFAAVEDLAGRLPPPRRAGLRILRDGEGGVLDTALVLTFPGPNSATGENCAELHLHGGRAVVAAVESALASRELRRAEAGEFTRRAFANGRMDLTEAEGLADLLSAETELQRRNAQALAGGALAQAVEQWRTALLTLAAEIEADLDFSDDDDVSALAADFGTRCAALASDLADWLDAPRAETLKEGFRVVLAGPPNAGKSSLFNALLGEDAAIATPIAGTTRDILTRPVAIRGIPFLFSDTAGLREGTDDAIERIGIDRARTELNKADLVLWLGEEGQGPAGAWEIETMIDLPSHAAKSSPHRRVSAVDGTGLSALLDDMVDLARTAMPRPGQVALSAHQGGLLALARDGLIQAGVERDPLLAAEQLRVARMAFDRLTGRAATEDMLDTLFGRFCIGK
ncbi:tRNA uridine-5-carboxymethylaminomethyl(34) synthesis GTPase MnmE [Croceicoccus naphthovorans]|uniref:tRNA modification GTPase MnmE n=1 Tax=Croceicoccus naphthovorans TaxID=1348774 RepID=A0A0G3XJ28_9SPHN|nr:tRNA uridine-5-carboxymethylaminomethyl(34) synthesis GTPase MnmE [Croceicoccus naphthovorans]AKM11192.1 tRNA modification GTPase TrmE [Croceicoccus naphthovorans]MBB3989915.1 tRNA modification GTPase [Croceicoccus naphthovorans]